MDREKDELEESILRLL